MPVFLSYVLSFVYLGIYWNNHHHLLQAAQQVNGGVLWANLHLLFWLSLVPFVTGWMGENHFAPLPVALYGVVLLHGGRRLLHPGARPAGHARPRFALASRDRQRPQGKGVGAIYAVAVPLSFLSALDLRAPCMCWWR